ncbi:CAAX protease self-immunity [Dethiosulfatibacter aminovorans DSM 17477]|uniref:CAAX protease self-immunity n=1 Tax=Dethiosulfatibacter aminovorans DSM 17477 TaxID=1121476 RepID=A0A1M6BHW6_9FIRM|nr:type II CAAX endopeptidase family protein [Dethiosulfatibacter aminovorans]SHI48370.1 CAAX protease self-immunity [Dethiosulfatibacter aminovorans DSM 17477]
MKTKKLLYIITTSLLTIATLYITDQVLMLSYNTKIAVKLITFLTFPLIYIFVTKDNIIKGSIENAGRNFRKLKIKSISTILGLVLFLFLIGMFSIFKGFLDMESMRTDFADKYKITKDNLLFYGLYMSFVNSLLEEYFFRGFIFLNLKKIGYRKTGYVTSSIMFAIYHIANFQNWFSPLLYILAIAGLFVGGTIFNLLDDKDNTFFNSWFVHICADLAIVLMGYLILI